MDPLGQLSKSAQAQLAAAQQNFIIPSDANNNDNSNN
jgi:hypothetical protein